MPLIILTGYPCSGLSYRARQLSTLLDQLQTDLASESKARYKIHIVTSHDAAHPRTVYDTARSEKQARAVVYGRVKRLLGRDSIVIVDGMNYIKGWRYQLWCESKEAKTTCCVVHVGTPVDKCVARNDERLKRKEAEKESKSEDATGADNTKSAAESESEPNIKEENAAAQNDPNSQQADEEPYPPELLNNLIFRYEEPLDASRWDKPLFTVPDFDPTPPIEEIWSAITGQKLEKPQTLSLLAQLEQSSASDNTTPSTAQSTATSTKPKLKPLSSRPKITPHQATARPASTDPSALYALEKRTSEIIATLRTFSLENRSSSSLSTQFLTDPTSKGVTIPVPVTETPIVIPASTLAAAANDDLAGAGGVLALPRLQRLRRQWIGMNRAYAGQGHGLGSGTVKTDQAGEAFVRFLNAEFEGEE